MDDAQRWATDRARRHDEGQHPLLGRVLLVSRNSGLHQAPEDRCRPRRFLYLTTDRSIGSLRPNGRSGMPQTAAVEVGSRDKILDAAEDLFARRGYAGIGMREVAEVAGLG